MEEPVWPVYRPETAMTIDHLVRSGGVFDYAGSGHVVELEQAFSNVHDGAFAVSFNSGTSALFAAYAALGLGEGDEVLVPNLTFLASVSPLLWLGATPVFVDSETNDPSISVTEIVRLLTPRTRAVVVTHVFGNPVDLAPIEQFCSQNRLRLIEDCSHAHASRYGSRHVGTFGDAAIYSLGARKIVSGGHGGVLVTRDEEVRDLAMLIGHFKPRTRTDIRLDHLRSYAEYGLGGNLRMSPLAAVLALDHLGNLDQHSRIRTANVAVLDSVFSGPLDPVRTASPRVNGTHFDVVYRLPDSLPTSERDALVGRLRAKGVDATAPATRPLNRVLAAIAAREHAGTRSIHLHRLVELASRAPADQSLPSSVGQHDRSISLPVGHLHRQNGDVVRDIAHRAAPVMEALVSATTE